MGDFFKKLSADANFSHKEKSDKKTGKNKDAKKWKEQARHNKKEKKRYKKLKKRVDAMSIDVAVHDKQLNDVTKFLRDACKQSQILPLCLPGQGVLALP